MHTRSTSSLRQFSLLTALLCISVCTTRAEDPCDSAETQQEIELCLQRETKLADSTLSFQLRKLEATMKGMRMTGQWALMSKEQKAWKARADAMSGWARKQYSDDRRALAVYLVFQRRLLQDRAREIAGAIELLELVD